MSEVKWIKIVVDIFDDEKIKLIEVLPDGDSIIVCWFKLLCLAGKTNNSGVMFLSDKIPYTDEMLATIFRKPIQTVRLALTTFEQFGMVEIVNGVITIPNWGKHQQMEQLESYKEHNRKYMQEYRARQKEKALTDGSVSDNVNNNVTYSNGDVRGTDIDVDSEVEGERVTVSKETVCSTDVLRVITAWNSLNLKQISRIAKHSNRDTWLKTRIRDYGIDEVLRAIENVRRSQYLMGNNRSGWQITFDWFLRPNNFPKVLDGNYDDRTYKQTSNVFLDMVKEEL